MTSSGKRSHPGTRTMGGFWGSPPVMVCINCCGPVPMATSRTSSGALRPALSLPLRGHPCLLREHSCTAKQGKPRRQE